MAVQISGNDITVPRDGSFTRNVTIGGTLTYEDVTNIDSVGLVTARTGIEIGARPGVAASISVDGNAIFSGITTATTLRAPTGIVTSLITNTARATTGIVTTLTTNTLTANSTTKVGSGVTLSPDGDVFATGVCTATSFSGSGANLTGISAGITEYDMWYLHTNHSADATSIILGRSDSSTANRITNLSSNLRVSAQIGTGMSLDTSTGYYTFPSTGKWLIIANCHVSLYGDDNAGIITKVTSDNGSNWYSHSLAYTGQDSGSTPHSATSFGFLDITDVSNQKIRFDQDSLGTNSYIIGNSSYIRTSFTFVRIGDT